MNDIERTLSDHLGYQFSNPELLERALTHSSTAHVNDGRRYSNERLEFLGDRVLGLVVARMVFETFPDEDEGALSRRFTALVRKETLARVAESWDLGRALRVAKSERGAGTPDNPAILADACEAVIAALYLDGGLKAAEQTIRAHWTALMDEDPKPPLDAKTALQEWAQGKNLALPDYQEQARKGPDHAPRFTVAVTVSGHGAAEGEGTSKRAAEQDAAERMLERLNDD